MNQSMLDLEIVTADLSDLGHQKAVLLMLEAYSADPMGDARPLSDFARANVIDGLRSHPTTLILLAMRGDQAIGIAVCFGGFSTFAAKPLINLHDFYVAAKERGRGVGLALLEAIENQARTNGCCKVTLEVQANNHKARATYKKFGFKQAVYAADATGGGSLFMTKPLS